MFTYPEKARFGRIVPKSKIYAQTNPSKKLRQLFVDQVDQIVWQYKLAPETINVPAKAPVTEIQVFDLVLRTDEISEDVLRCIDRAIQFPIFFQTKYNGKVKSIAAYKRPSEADSAKWVVDLYFDTAWQPEAVASVRLPLALDMSSLYEQMLKQHLDVPARSGESFQGHIERIREMRQTQGEIKKLEKRIAQEKQFNRKAELNSQLQELKQNLKALNRPK